MRARTLAVTIAALTVGAGVARAVSGGRSDDLLQVHSWLVYWLFEAANPYTGIIAVNYPPHAFVVLAPLGVIPASVVPVVWAVLNAVLAPVVSWWLIRDWPIHRDERVLVAALVTAWNAVMTGIWMGQFTLLSVLFGVLALRAVPFPWLAGALLAASAIKPHVGIIFLGWALVRGHYRALVGAATWGLIGLLVMALWARTSPIEIVQTWLDVLAWMFGGANPQQGVTAWWGLVAAWVPATTHSVLGTVGAVVGLVVLGLALRAVAPRDDTGRMTLALIALWSLATLFHRRYDLILLAPAFACLWVTVRDTRPSSRWRWAGLLFLHVALVVDVPWAWQMWRGGPAVAVGPLSWVAVHFDRLIVLAAAVAVWRSWSAPTSTAAT